MNALRFTVLAAVLACVASACGGSHGAATTTSGVAGAQTAEAASPAGQKAAIEQVWKRFFSSKTPPAQKAALLQNGSAFSAAIQAQSKSPLARNTSATVSKVTLHGSRATVVYSIDLAGKPALQNQKGTAVKVGGGWRVGDKSFCSLLALGGKPPAACAKATS